MKTAGVVLAGGLSRRFGSPKAFAKFGETYFYKRAIDALEPHCTEVIVVTRPELLSGFSEKVKVITDLPDIAGLGPLAGILSAMESVEADRYAVLPCDMPYIDDRVIGRLKHSHKSEVTAVKDVNKYHPLVSIWEDTTKAALRDALQRKQLRMMNLLDKLQVTWIDGNALTDERHTFTNVNTPINLERR